ncbi:alpha/beta hydrolase [Actinomadura flavalba]|uniref:alpha/beta hydrolase n=1 Tax=Actinomadura flavalba TaxID=1120938 RepID=UPI000378B19C|nr:alpha/beta hydrolase family protein [Actinomadura flavalba]
MRVLRRLRLPAALSAAGALALGLLTAPPAVANAAAPHVLPRPNSHGITLHSLQQVDGDPRMLDAVVGTAAIFQPVHVRIHLPAGYNRSGNASRYPSLYLLHGANDPLDDAKPWAAPAPAVSGRIAETVAATPFNGIVVMPDGGKSGFYTDWATGDAAGRRPQWETFHIQQLLPWIDANFRTVANRGGRSIAGYSMGGFGALSYAGRHPGLFSAVAAFSGITDIVDDMLVQQTVIANNLTLLTGSAITEAQRARAGQDGHLARDIVDVFGPYGTWRQRNPWDLTGVYAAERPTFALYTGTGGLDVLESLALGQNNKLHTRLRQQGSAHRYCRGGGTHTWSYWREDLKDFLRYAFGPTPSSCPNGWGAPVS